GCTGCCGKINRTQNCTRGVRSLACRAARVIPWSHVEADRLSGHPASLNRQGVRSSESWSRYEAEEMDGGATEATECFVETSLVLAKGSGKKDKNTRLLHHACSSVLVWLDTAQFVRDGTMHILIMVRKFGAELVGFSFDLS